MNVALLAAAPRAGVHIPRSQWDEVPLRLGEWYGLRVRVRFPGVRPEGLEHMVAEAFRQLQATDLRAFHLSTGAERPLKVRWQLTGLEASPPGFGCCQTYQLDFFIERPPAGYVAPSLLLGPIVRALATQLGVILEAVERLEVQAPEIPTKPEIPEPRPLIEIDTQPLADVITKVTLFATGTWLLIRLLSWGGGRKRER